MDPVLDLIRNHGVLFIAGLAIVEGFLCVVLLRKIERLKARLKVAVAAAEDAARAAALAAPGGIDPEIVIQLLRSGKPASLEAVYQLMEQQMAAEAAEASQRASSREAAGA